MPKRFSTTLFLTISIGMALPAFAAPAQDKLKADTFRALSLRNIGPGLMSGRIADIAIHPHNRAIWYVAVGSGGVWKTVNSGTTWTPLFDSQGSYSIGCVTIDPSHPDTIWVGSGENVSGRHVGYGDGVYKSLDGGSTWKNMGLGDSQHIAKILVDPRDSNVVFVASEGPLWSSGGDRGVFKSVDAGATWRPVLAISENTGATDLEFDPANPEILYAASYQRRRKIWALLAGGPESGIHKSVDGGETWKEVTKGLPGGEMGKIGLAVSPIRPEVVYATIEADRAKRGFYRSTDRGESWEKRSSYISNGTGPHYYQEIYASPHRFDRVFQMDVWIHITEDGGSSFHQLGEPSKHSDNHALAFDPQQPDYLLAGCDGGLYESWDHGKSWKFVSNLPVTQIYKMALDNALPFYNVVGGTQDNGTITGPSRTTRQHGIQNRDWIVPFGADGYACQVDPTDPNLIYLTWQNGNLLRYDRRRGEPLDIKPQPAPGDEPERWNWDAPILISPHSSSRLYFASQRLWRSDDRGNSWKAISRDLSRARNRYELPMIDNVPGTSALYDNGAMSWYGNITSVSESPRQEGLIYVGTDDGLIQVTENGGGNWHRIDSIPGIPASSFVNDVKASLHDSDTVFAVFANHKEGDFTPYLVKSTDKGRSWSSIAGDLPERHILWGIVQDHVAPDLLFAATEFGLFFTPDGGSQWIELNGGVPNISFRDLEIQRRENDLVGASFGRGFYILDDYSPLREVNSSTLAAEGHLFSVRKALLYVPSVDLGVRGQGYQGGSFYSADNPPFGAVFTYSLRDSVKTSAAQRREAESKLREQGKDAAFPGWESLGRESLEEESKVMLTVTDSRNAVVRRLEGPSKAGLHRIAWDLRYPASLPTRLQPRPVPIWSAAPAGPFVTPGTYRVQLSRFKDGRLEALGDARTFEVAMARPGGGNRQEILAFQQRTGELQRRTSAASRIVQETSRRLEFVRKALLDTPKAAPELMERARALQLRMADISRKLLGDSTRRRLREPSSPSIANRVGQIVNGHWYTTQGPTATHRASLEIAAQEFQEVARDLRQLRETDLPRLEEQMEAAGAPWTPGRRLPR